LGGNERLDFLAMVSLNDARMSYLRTDGSFPIASLDGTNLDGAQFQISADYSQSDPDLTKVGSPSFLALKSNEWSARAGLMVPFLRSRSQNLFGRFGLTLRENENQTILGQIFNQSSKDRLAILEARLSWDKADQYLGINLADVALRQGLDIFGANVDSRGVGLWRSGVYCSALVGAEVAKTAAIELVLPVGGAGAVGVRYSACL
jgi:hemolysin activation/secretion protein